MCKHLGWYWLKMTPLYWPTHITLWSSTTIMSHYLGVTVWSAFHMFCFSSFFLLFLVVCWYLSCLSLCFAGCMSYLSVCIIMFCILWFVYIYIWAYGQNTINWLKSLSRSPLPPLLHPHTNIHTLSVSVSLVPLTAPLLSLSSPLLLKKARATNVCNLFSSVIKLVVTGISLLKTRLSEPVGPVDSAQQDCILTVCCLSLALCLSRLLCASIRLQLWELQVLAIISHFVCLVSCVPALGYSCGNYRCWQ